MRSLKNHFPQFPRTMRALRIFHLTISLLTLQRNTKQLQYAKNFQNLDIYFFSTYMERNKVQLKSYKINR